MKKIIVCCAGWIFTRRASRYDHLCCLVVGVSGYRSRGPGSIPSVTRLSKKQWVWNRAHSASWVQLRRYLEEKLCVPVYKAENRALGIRQVDHAAKLAWTSLTSDGRSVGIFHSRIQAAEFVFSASQYRKNMLLGISCLHWESYHTGYRNPTLSRLGLANLIYLEGQI
jgi:hypothetical protein